MTATALDAHGGGRLRVRRLPWWNVALRMTVGAVVTLLLSPLLACLVLSVPDCGMVRVWERAAVVAARVLAGIMAIEVELAEPHSPDAYQVGAVTPVRMPLIRSWTSPLHSGYVSRTVDQPGRWMSDSQLNALVDEMVQVARDSMDELPQYGVFGDRAHIRRALSNRIVTLAYDVHGVPCAFTAMVYLPLCPAATTTPAVLPVGGFGWMHAPARDSFVIHLGLTMISRKHRGRRIQSPVFSKCLSLPLFNQRRLGFTVTNIGASPAGIGAVSDYFQGTFPDYQGRSPRTEFHLQVARHVLKHFRHEFGCSRKARFDEGVFVVRGSNDADGGGASQFIKVDGQPVSRYRDERCNRFCEAMLDLTRGDEIFQVARVHTLGTLLQYRRLRRGAGCAALRPRRPAVTLGMRACASPRTAATPEETMSDTRPDLAQRRRVYATAPLASPEWEQDLPLKAPPGGIRLSPSWTVIAGGSCVLSMALLLGAIALATNGRSPTWTDWLQPLALPSLL
ncbi:hypothetical protein CDCA_CDCA01G0305 [Cyanidium caldarium]|uniref:Alpha-type protein kinase domain-containing protein n=1 Tax=Cyanidium caldarium TaxID=2771 RepID=A0AAV9IQA2_CYACA|nr:hypothetical protein CDCA_CDCA01G0305 [Cyanidium caldarium]